jgi:hypothetical protein
MLKKRRLTLTVEQGKVLRCDLDAIASSTAIDKVDSSKKKTMSNCSSSFGFEARIYAMHGSEVKKGQFSFKGVNPFNPASSF